MDEVIAKAKEDATNQVLVMDYTHGLCSYGLCSYGLGGHNVVMANVVMA